MTPTAATITTKQTLELLDGPFASVASGVAEGHYAFWLGSGISFGRVDGLSKIIPRLLEFLRSKIDPATDNCRFKSCLQNALALASITDVERARIDFGQPFDAWVDAAAISHRLTTNYARLLDLTVDGEPMDYLLWDGVAVGSTYANPATLPDVEHLCIAILALEGVAPEIATANWDGLVERATDELSDAHPIVVCVRAENLKEPNRQVRLYKFHGCAIRAVSDEPSYRQYLIARAPQINDWATAPEHAAMVTRLVDIVVSRPTLMLGLSAQDANIQALFAKARVTSPWTWPAPRPSLVFSEDKVGLDQQALLQNVYRDSYSAANRNEISDRALIRAFAKQLLLALVLHVHATKFKRLIGRVTGDLPLPEREALATGIATLRDRLAVDADNNRLVFVRRLIDYQARAINLFRDGSEGALPRLYNPLTTSPTNLIDSDLNLPATGLCEAAVATAILGLGERDGHWTIWPSDVSDPTSGTIQLRTGSSSARVLLINNSHIAVRLSQNGHLVESDDLIVIYAQETAPESSRSPLMAPGRTGKLGTRQVSIREILGMTTNLKELVQEFRARVAL